MHRVDPRGSLDKRNKELITHGYGGVRGGDRENRHEADSTDNNNVLINASLSVSTIGHRLIGL